MKAPKRGQTGAAAPGRSRRGSRACVRRAQRSGCARRVRAAAARPGRGPAGVGPQRAQPGGAPWPPPPASPSCPPRSSSAWKSRASPPRCAQRTAARPSRFWTTLPWKTPAAPGARWTPAAAWCPGAASARRGANGRGTRVVCAGFAVVRRIPRPRRSQALCVCGGFGARGAMDVVKRALKQQLPAYLKARPLARPPHARADARRRRCRCRTPSRASRS